MMSYKRLKNCA